MLRTATQNRYLLRPSSLHRGCAVGLLGLVRGRGCPLKSLQRRGEGGLEEGAQLLNCNPTQILVTLGAYLPYVAHYNPYGSLPIHLLTVDEQWLRAVGVLGAGRHPPGGHLSQRQRKKSGEHLHASGSFFASFIFLACSTFWRFGMT